MNTAPCLPSLRYAHIYLTVLVTLLIGLFIDGVWISNIMPHSQWVTNALTFMVFIWVYSQVSPRLKKLILYGLVIALGGELVFSLGLGMYTYRLHNLPIYVPLGHTLIYTAVYYLIKEPRIKAMQPALTKVLFWAMILYSAGWLIFARDLFGFACTLLILWVFHRRPHTKPYFLAMFFAVVLLELLGTYFQCWAWPEIWFGKFTWVSSANPPAGIAVFYFGFDAGCLWFYKRLNPQIWDRFMRLR